MPDAKKQMPATYEEFLDSLSEKMRKAILGHAFSFCTLEGDLLTPPIEQENLFDVIGKMERYVVDSNANWKAESAKPQNRNKAFVLSKTITDEQDNILGLFFRNVDLSNGNIFICGARIWDDDPEHRGVLLERLDYHYRGVMDEEKLIASAKPTVEKIRLKDAHFIEHQTKLALNVEIEKQMILRGFKIEDISQLDHPDDLKQERAYFLSIIHNEAPRCGGNYVRSIWVARLCYALLLMEKIRMRTEFAKPDYLNVLGDTRLIQVALFLQANLLSNDWAVKRMASYAGVKCIGSF